MITLDELYDQLSTSERGLTNERRKILKAEGNLNIIPSPNKCPTWLCCLLPCLLKTKSMKLYKKCLPMYAEVKINDKWIRIDPAGLLIGDLVHIVAGNSVPADLRIIEVWPSQLFLNYSSNSCLLIIVYSIPV